MANIKVEYTKVGDGFVYGNWYADGASVFLLPGQENYLLLSGVIKKKVVATLASESATAKSELSHGRRRQSER